MKIQGRFILHSILCLSLGTAPFILFTSCAGDGDSDEEIEEAIEEELGETAVYPIK